MAIEYRDLRVLGDEEKPVLNKLTDEYYRKISRKLNNPKLILKFKKYNQAGKRVKYSIHARLDNPNLIASAKAHDWDFARALHKVMKKIINEIKHKYKLEGNIYRKKRAGLKRKLGRLERL